MLDRFLTFISESLINLSGLVNDLRPTNTSSLINLESIDLGQVNFLPFTIIINIFRWKDGKMRGGVEGIDLIMFQ